MPSFTDRAYRIRQWAEVFQGRPRKSITARDISSVLEQWRKTGAADGGPLSVASLNTRRTALMHLYSRLDGRNAYNPVKDVPKYDESASHRDRALPMLTVARLLWRLWPKSKTRARLRVLMWTGWPHALLKGVTADDVDWKGQRVRLGRRRKGKGMEAAWVPVLPAAVRALRRLEALNAWGEFSNAGMRSVLARAVAAENVIRARKKQPPLPPVHPYQIRHSFATWAAGVLKDDRALKELLRTNSIERYTEGALAGRLDAARDVLRGSRGSLSSPFRHTRHKDRQPKARQPKPQKQRVPRQK